MEKIKREWRSIEVPQRMHDLLHQYYKDRNITFDCCECYNLVHFSCLVSEKEERAFNDWMDTLPEEMFNVNE